MMMLMMIIIINNDNNNNNNNNDNSKCVNFLLDKNYTYLMLQDKNIKNSAKLQ